MNNLIINNIKKNGYHIFRSVLNKKKQSQYLKVVKRLKYTKQAGFFDGKTLERKLILNLQRKNVIFLDLLNIKIINEINIYFLNDKFYRIIDPKLPNYILSQFAATASGSTTLPLHVDDKAPSTSENVNYLQWMIPLVDMNSTNGCTQVAPKTHRSGVLRPVLKKNTPIIDLKLNVGDMAVIDGRIWHAGKSRKDNSKNEDRWLIVITYCKWFFKPHYDIARSFPKKFMHKLTTKLKIILGFASITKFSEKNGILQKGDLNSANKFLKKRIY